MNFCWLKWYVEYNFLKCKFRIRVTSYTKSDILEKSVFFKSGGSTNVNVNIKPLHYATIIICNNDRRPRFYGLPFRSV